MSKPPAQQPARRSPGAGQSPAPAQRLAAAQDVAAQRREFIRTHHPDRGGDAVLFAQGLARFDAVGGRPEPVPGVTVYRRRRWSPPGLLQAWRIHRRRRRVGRRTLR